MVSWLPSFSSVVWSALRAGGCGFVSWRVSLHAASGRVAVAPPCVGIPSFGDSAVAAAFARQWSRLLRRAVVMRQGPVIGGSVRSWRVSVPVLVWAGSASAGQLLVRGGPSLRRDSGGVRGVAPALRAIGFVSASA
jgi:hypothetical protein